MTDLLKYADAIFLLAEEEGMLESVQKELETVNTVLRSNPEYSRILDTPALSKDERLKLIDAAFGTLGEYVQNLLKMLSTSHSTYAFPRLYSAFTKLYNEKKGIVSVEVISAVALTESERSKLKANLERKLCKKVEIINNVDKSILGGIVLRYDSLQLDGSVKTRLDNIERSLKSAAI